jgi:hypothetical protein
MSKLQDVVPELVLSEDISIWVKFQLVTELMVGENGVLAEMSGY